MGPVFRISLRPVMHAAASAACRQWLGPCRPSTLPPVAQLPTSTPVLLGPLPPCPSLQCAVSLWPQQALQLSRGGWPGLYCPLKTTECAPSPVGCFWALLPPPWEGYPKNTEWTWYRGRKTGISNERRTTRAEQQNHPRLSQKKAAAQHSRTQKGCARALARALPPPLPPLGIG